MKHDNIQTVFFYIYTSRVSLIVLELYIKSEIRLYNCNRSSNNFNIIKNTINSAISDTNDLGDFNCYIHK